MKYLVLLAIILLTVWLWRKISAGGPLPVPGFGTFLRTTIPASMRTWATAAAGRAAPAFAAAAALLIVGRFFLPAEVSSLLLYLGFLGVLMALAAIALVMFIPAGKLRTWTLVGVGAIILYALAPVMFAPYKTGTNAYCTGKVTRGIKLSEAKTEVNPGARCTLVFQVVSGTVIFDGPYGASEPITPTTKVGRLNNVKWETARATSANGAYVDIMLCQAGFHGDNWMCQK